jgi:hypothetical protein
MQIEVMDDRSSSDQEEIHPKQEHRHKSQEYPRDAEDSLIKTDVLIEICGVGNMPGSATLLTVALQNAQSRVSHEVTSRNNLPDIFIPFAQVNRGTHVGECARSDL